MNCSGAAGERWKSRIEGAGLDQPPGLMARGAMVGSGYRLIGLRAIRLVLRRASAALCEQPSRGGPVAGGYWDRPGGIRGGPEYTQAPGISRCWEAVELDARPCLRRNRCGICNCFSQRFSVRRTPDSSPARTILAHGCERASRLGALADRAPLTDRAGGEPSHPGRLAGDASREHSGNAGAGGRRLHRLSGVGVGPPDEGCRFVASHTAVLPAAHHSGARASGLSRRIQTGLTESAGARAAGLRAGGRVCAAGEQDERRVILTTLAAGLAYVPPGGYRGHVLARRHPHCLRVILLTSFLSRAMHA